METIGPCLLWPRGRWLTQLCPLPGPDKCHQEMGSFSPSALACPLPPL